MKEIMQQMLQNVVTHFSENPIELRSINQNGECLYNPPVNKPKSIGCALGMYINTKNAQKLDKSDSGTSISTIFKEKKNLKYIPKWMQDLDYYFLQSLQDLHDIENYWTKNNISKESKSWVKQICIDYDLNFEAIKFKKK